MSRLTVACVSVMLAPIGLAVAGFVWVSIGESTGATPFAGTMARNSAEAAGMGNAAQVLRFLRRGDDPRQVYPIHPSIISSSVLQATTLEAAMWSRQLALIRLLDREATIAGTDERSGLACLARDLGVDDVVEYLAPDGISCEPGQALERVVARTRETGTR